MIWTKEEKAKLKIVKISRKNVILRYLMIPVMVLLTISFSIYRKIKSNTKRIMIIFGSLFLEMIYCSFSFPLFIHSGAAQETTAQIEESDVVFASEDALLEETALEQEEFLDEEQDDYDMPYSMISYDDYYFLDDVLDYEGVSASEREDAKLDLDNLSFERDDWKLVLINKQNSIPDDYEVTLGTINTMKGARQCDARIIDELLQMITDAKADGVTLAICSPYRDMQYQERLFNKKIVNYMGRGMSYLDAYQLASQAVTLPGASEHQIGLALDIVTNSYTTLDEGFGRTAAGIWLKENSYRYGFILRYPQGKEFVTGIEYEPWHYRYVGVEAATVIMQNEMTLEEFWEEYL